MKYLSTKNSVQRFQAGGQMAGEPMPAEGGAPVEGGAPMEGGAPAGGAEDQLAQLAQQLLEMLLQQIGDPQAVAAVLQMAMEMLQEAAGQGQPTFKKGGKLVKKSKKASCGIKMTR